MDLGPIREKIDALDRRLVELLNERLTLASEIGRVKRSAGGQIYVAEREDAVLRKVTGQNSGPIRNEALRAIYREIMSAAIALEKPLVIAYLGPEASNTHAAALRKFGASVEYHPMASVSDIFTAVEKGEIDHAVIPIENSTEGSVREAQAGAAPGTPHDVCVRGGLLRHAVAAAPDVFSWAHAPRRLALPDGVKIGRAHV